MDSRETIYVDGAWREPHGTDHHPVVDPRTGETVTTVRLADEVDVDRAVAAARRAYEARDWPLESRLKTLRDLHERIAARTDEFAQVISSEMGAPDALSRTVQVGMPLSVLATTIEVAEGFAFDTPIGQGSFIAREPIGVVAAITPWNFPLHQAIAKIGSALAAGCPVVLKPAELTPLSSYLLAEVADEVGVPAGWLNVLAGRGTVVGEALASHPNVDLVTFTGSTAVGRRIGALAAETVKRVTLELGGKSPSVLLDDLDDAAFAQAVQTSVGFGLLNTGQTCAAWTRLLVPEGRYDEAASIAAATAAAVGPTLGPLVSELQWERVAGHLSDAVEDGAVVVSGDPTPTRPDAGFRMEPVVLGRVTRDMRVASNEVFGPVLSIMTYRDEDDAVAIANATPYGLSAGVFAADHDRAVAVARRIRSGTVHVNGLNSNRFAPFGGYGQSGNGREYGELGLLEFLEVKSIQPPAEES